MKKALILCLVWSLLFSGIMTTSAYASNSAESLLEPVSQDIPLNDVEMNKIRSKVKQFETYDSQQLRSIGILGTTVSVPIGTNKTIYAADSGTVYRSDYPILQAAGVQAVMDGLIAGRSTVTRETAEKETPGGGLENMYQSPVPDPEIVLSHLVVLTMVLCKHLNH